MKLVSLFIIAIAIGMTGLFLNEIFPKWSFCIGFITSSLVSFTNPWLKFNP